MFPGVRPYLRPLHVHQFNANHNVSATQDPQPNPYNTSNIPLTIGVAPLNGGDLGSVGVATVLARARWVGGPPANTSCNGFLVNSVARGDINASANEGWDGLGKASWIGLRVNSVARGDMRASGIAVVEMAAIDTGLLGRLCAKGKELDKSSFGRTAPSRATAAGENRNGSWLFKVDIRGEVRPNVASLSMASEGWSAVIAKVVDLGVGGGGDIVVPGRWPKLVALGDVIPKDGSVVE